MLKSQQDFINKILPGAKRAHSDFGVLPSLTLAQACLESSFGKSAPGNMLFGIKWTPNCGFESQLLKTREWYSKNTYDALVASGEWYELIETKGTMYHVRIKAKFRKYATYEESIIDHTKLLTSTRYRSVIASKDYKEACLQIKKCGYATDLDYTATLINLIEQYNLNQYDEVQTMKYSKIALTHVIEIDPLDLRISVQDKAANTINLPNFVTPGFITWDAIYENGKKLNKVKGVPLSILASEGKIICNRQPHVGFGNVKFPAGTLIVYKDGAVAVKSITDLDTENDVWFAVGGCSILPKIRMKEEGFCIRKCLDGKTRDFSDIGRTTSRPVMGYNPTTKKIIIAVRPDSNIARGRQTLINLGCTMGITLDAGGSAVLKVDNKTLVNTTRQLYGVITF